MTTKNIHPDIQGASIVALGHFNPAIFHPLWLAQNNLIREEEAKAAELQLLQKDVALVSVEWFDMQVTSDRFSIETKSPSMFHPLRDLALGIFTILEHTPVQAFGFNAYQHTALSSPEEWVSIETDYAPKKPWASIIDSPSLRTLVIEGNRSGSKASRTQIIVEPSKTITPGMFAHINEHYDIREEDVKCKNSAFFVDALEMHWIDFIATWGTIATLLLAKHKENK